MPNPPELAGAPGWLLRPAREADARTLWQWRNDEGVRQESFGPELIPWESHQSWLRGRLADADHCRIWIAERAGEAAGQVRYEAAGADALVSLSVGAPWRGQGCATWMLRFSAPLAFRELAVRRLVAYVKPTNPASRRAFCKAGYQADEVQKSGSPCWQFVLHWVQR